MILEINNTFLKNITLREKIELIFNTKLWVNSILNESKINKINFLEDYNIMEKDAKVLTSLANSYHLDLVKKYAEIKTSTFEANNNIVVIPFGLINKKNTIIHGVDSISDDLQYIKMILTTYITALKEKDIVVIGLYDNEIGSKLEQSLLHLLTNVGLDAIIFANDAPSIHDIDFEQLIFKKSSNENQISYTLINNITSIDQKDIEKSLQLYEENELRLSSGTITLEEFNELVNEELFYIDQIVSQIKCFTDKVYNNQTLMNSMNNDLENGKFYWQLAYQSSVFYMKKEGILERLTKKSVAFMGDFFSNQSIFKDQDILKEDIYNYFPSCIGFFDENNNLDDIIKKVEVVIFKISILNNEEFNLGNQLEIIKSIYNKGINVIVIVPSEYKLLQIDLKTSCSVILKADLYNSSSFYGLLDILSLKVESEGRLSKAISVEKEISIYEGTFNDDYFYGLNNSLFEYKRLKSKLPTIDFTVTNLDSKRNFDVIQIYIYDESKGNSTNKVLIGFKKIFLYAKETKLISINIDLDSLDFYNYNIDLNSKLVIELRSFNTKLKLRTYNKNTKKALKRTNFKPEILILLLLYFNVPLYIALRSINNADYRLIIVIIILIVNYLIFKVVFRKSKQKKQKKNIKELITVVDEIDYLEAREEIVLDHDLPKEDIIVDNEMESIRNESNEIMLAEKIFKDKFNMGKYCQMFRSSMEESGLKIEARLFKELFSTMLTTRLFITSPRDNKINIQFLKHFSNFIGSSIFIGNLQSNATFEMLLNNEKSGLKKCLNSAQKDTDTIHLMVFKDIELVMDENIISELLNYFENPYLIKNIMNIPENIWFIFVPKESTHNISEKISFCSFYLNIEVELVKPTNLNQNILKLSYHYLIDSYNNSKELFFLKEEIWKKIDKLETYLNKHFDFKFDNQYLRQLERYLSMYLMSDGEPYEAIDSLLSQKILLDIINKPAINNDQEEESLLDLCDRLFGLDNFVKARHLLSKINENIIGQEK